MESIRKIVKNLILEQEMKTKTTKTDCREEIGITVGLIDSIITQCRILKTRDLKSKAVQEALKDLYSDEDLKFILKQK